MRVVWLAAAGVGVAALAAAGWVLAQPSDSIRTRPALTNFRRAPIVEVPAGQLARTDLAAARLRPQAVSLRDSLARTAAARVDLRAVDRSRVPVLVTAQPALVSSLRVFPRGDSFSASARQPGLSVVIDGTRSAVAAPPAFRLPAARTLRPLAASPQVRLRPSDGAAAMDRSAAVVRPEVAARDLQRSEPRPAPGVTAPTGALEHVVVEQTEYGVDVSFVRFGAAYNVSIACDDPQNDPNCTPEGATALVRRLEIIGGGEAQ